MSNPTIETIAYTCVHNVWKGYAYQRCGKKADATGLCGRHKPDVRAAAKARRDAKMEAQIASIREKEAERKSIIRDAARYRWLRGRISGAEYRRLGLDYGEISDVDGLIDKALIDRTQETK